MAAQDPPTRPASIRSNRSVTSTMSALFRRGTSRKTSAESADRSSFSVNHYDNTSTRSRQSVSSARPSMSQHSKAATHPLISVSNVSSRHLQSKHSMASIQSDSSYGDAVSVASRRTGHRSTKSRGPPSSFNLRYHDIPLPDEQDLVHDQEILLKMSSAEIRQEIERIEAEARRLLDAYSGLEISTLAKRQGDTSATHRRQQVDRRPSNWTLMPEEATDAVVSSTAASTQTRATSSANMGSVRSTSGSIRGSRSHLVLPTQSSSGSLLNLSATQEEDGDVTEIRRKRDEMRVRYERKVELLQAMLRSAELKEKLNKKRK